MATKRHRSRARPGLAVTHTVTHRRYGSVDNLSGGRSQSQKLARRCKVQTCPHSVVLLFHPEHLKLSFSVFSDLLSVITREFCVTKTLVNSEQNCRVSPVQCLESQLMTLNSITMSPYFAGYPFQGNYWVVWFMGSHFSCRLVHAIDHSGSSSPHLLVAL